MMGLYYKSTRDSRLRVKASEAILKGLAPDGGLFVPEKLPVLDVRMEELKNMSYQETAYAVMKQLADIGLLHTDCMTVTGHTVGENIKDAVNKNPEVIRPIDNPYSKTGGLAVLKGNLAPDGSVVKRSAVVQEMMVHEGPARVL